MKRKTFGVSTQIVAHMRVEHTLKRMNIWNAKKKIAVDAKPTVANELKRNEIDEKNLSARSCHWDSIQFSIPKFF